VQLPILIHPILNSKERAARSEQSFFAVMIVFHVMEDVCIVIIFQPLN
jgi:hypothetical protein